MSAQNRPAPRRSSLTGSSPVTPPPPAAAVEPKESLPFPVAVEQEARPTADPAPAPVRAKTKYPPKVSFYQDRADTDRVRGAILHTMASEGARSLSQFIQRAVMAEVERLEAKYNDGRPFPPVGARELPQGRPMGD